MDILIHTATGIAIGTIVALLAKKRLKKSINFIVVGVFGAALPDIDAISLWSKFDATIGQFFSLQHSGKVIYSETFWYSHHGFTHSLVAGILFGLLLLAVFYFIKWLFRRNSKQSFFRYFINECAPSCKSTCQHQ